MVSSENTHAQNTIQTEQAICRNMYVYTHKHSITIVKKGGHECGGEWAGAYWEGLQGRKGREKWYYNIKKTMKRTWIFEPCMFLQEDLGDPRVHHELSLEKDCSRRHLLVSMYPFSAILFFLCCILPAQFFLTPIASMTSVSGQVNDCKMGNSVPTWQRCLSEMPGCMESTSGRLQGVT